MGQASFILLVEDDSRIARIEQAFLEHAGYSVLVETDGIKAFATISRFSPDLIVLDRMLPGKDGLTLCRELRQITDVPVLMVTALDSEADRLEGFAAGVDDYLCKPFNPSELVARVGAILRRTRHQPVSGFLLNAATSELFIQGTPVELTRTEFSILQCLVQNKNRTVDRQTLLDSCPEKENNDIYDRTIDNHIKNIRKKISRISSESYILSAYGQGYVLKMTE